MDDWLGQHPWIRSASSATAASSVYHVSPTRWVLLPKEEPPEDLRAFLTKFPLVPGKSAVVVTMELGLHPKWSDHIAVIGKKAGLWDLWPAWNDPSWKFNMGHFPFLVEPT